MRRPSLAILISAALALPALADDVDYKCEDGTELEVRFDTPASGYGSAVLKEDGAKPLALPQGMSGSGARYTDGTTEFWIKGNSATLTRGGKAITCETD